MSPYFQCYVYSDPGTSQSLFDVCRRRVNSRGTSAVTKFNLILNGHGKLLPGSTYSN